MIRNELQNSHTTFNRDATSMHLESLQYRASDAAEAMEFDSEEELNLALRRAMELCRFAGLPVETNFKRFYKSASHDLEYDYKLSLLAYRLVCISGKSSNPNVAQLTVQALKNGFTNHQ